MRLVVDASVIAKWVLPEPTPWANLITPLTECQPGASAPTLS